MSDSVPDELAAISHCPRVLDNGNSGLCVFARARACVRGCVCVSAVYVCVCTRARVIVCVFVCNINTYII
jgi:hypothetical protein